jgi:NADPH-dependent curcumin reductase CurA
MQGFIVFDYVKQYTEARKELAQWLSEGKIKRKETVIKGGLDKAADGLRDLYKGVNTGKCFKVDRFEYPYHAYNVQANCWLRSVP